jgi:hypothetical protein
MGANKSKLKCLILPAQSGKTRKVEEQIKRFNLINDLFGHNGEINIWISANNKLLVHQTTSRIRKDLCTSSDSDDEGESDAVIKGKIFSWTSGTKKTNISAKELAFEILNDVDMVILCAHSVRVRYLISMLGYLTVHSAFNKKINIWIDEADKTINIWSKYPELLNNLAINQVTLISATFNAVVDKYGRLNIIPYEVTHPACYRRLKDAKRIVEDVGKSSPVEYVRHVLNKHKATLVKPGMRAFIPGDYTKQSHEDIAEMLLTLGFAVIILNGTHKELRIPGEEPTDLHPYMTVSDPDEVPDEFNTTLARMYNENNLNRYPLAITGFICVERGITFQCAPVENDHLGFLFDYGIIPPITDKAEAYQTMARLFGNVGDFPDYKQCEIYTNSATFKRAQNQEEIAVNLARIVAEQGLTEVGPEHFEEATDPEEYKRKEVPIVVPMDSATLATINELSTEDKRAALITWLAKTYPNMAAMIAPYTVKKIICPEETYSKKRHIDMNVRAAEKKQKITFNLTPKDHLVNNWQCVLDKDGERAIYIIYHGETGRTPSTGRTLSDHSNNPFDSDDDM